MSNPSIIEHDNFPEVLTIDEADELPNFKTFTDGNANDLARAAHKFAKKVRGVVYTQVDADAPWLDNIVYVKGFHLVNRTGVYAVAWRKASRAVRSKKNREKRK